MPQARQKFDFNFKIAFAGNAGVGKTALMVRFTKGTFQERLCTVGICSDTKIVSTEDGSRVQLEIWDTAGQERFRTITQSYYRNADGLMLLYDITKYESLMGLTHWIEDVKRYAASDTLMVLVGAKQDLATEKREISIEQAKSFALHYPEIVDVVETSAKESVNIETVFMTLTQALKEQRDTKRTAINIVRSPTFRDIHNQHKPRLCSKLCSFNDCCN